MKGADVDNRTCSINNCESPARKRGWCGKHYLRWYTHGDPRHERPQYHQCRIDGCDNKPRSLTLGLCEMHYYRVRRHGDPAAVTNTRHLEVKYRAAHARIERDRGKARTHSCVDCGTIAQHWSYTHDDPNERVSPIGQPYSLDPTRYEPRCAPCHARYDGTGVNQYSRSTQ